MTNEEMKSRLAKIKKSKGVEFVKQFCDGTILNLPDGSLIVDGHRKTKFSGIDCMQALTLPAYFAGFDEGVHAVIELLQQELQQENA